jgi:hypothetical protein
MAPTQSTKVSERLLWRRRWTNELQVSKTASNHHKTTPSPIHKKPVPRKPHTNVTKSYTKPCADPQFPFLKLPGEIRNRIYEYALVDPEHTISLHYNKSRSRPPYKLAAKRILMGRSDFHDCNWTKMAKERRKEAESELDARLPFKWRLNGRICAELLLVCKQINAEATSYLYEKNYFVFLDTTIMDLFLQECGENIRLLRRIGLAYFDMKSPAKHQYSAFKQLIKADRLEALVLGESCISSMRRRSYYLNYKPADMFYRVAGSWLWYLAGCKGDRSAALDLLYVGYQQYQFDNETQRWQTFFRFRHRFDWHYWGPRDQDENSFQAEVLGCMG